LERLEKPVLIDGLPTSAAAWTNRHESMSEEDMVQGPTLLGFGGFLLDGEQCFPKSSTSHASYKYAVLPNSQCNLCRGKEATAVLLHKFAFQQVKSTCDPERE
jgi:hypothetical protein